MLSHLPRLAAALAGVCTLVGVGLVVSSVVSTRRLWFDGYVSEAGVGPQASSYRLGMLGLAIGLVLLGVALSQALPLAAVLLAAGGVFAGLSGSVPCSPGCPLPPYESATAGDLVHGAASILAVGAVALAIIVTALGPAPLQRLSRLAIAVVVPLLAAMGICMLALGKGHVTGLLERACLALVAAWTLVMCLRLSIPRRVPLLTGRR